MLNKKVLCAQNFSSTKANVPEIVIFIGWSSMDSERSLRLLTTSSSQPILFFYFYFISIEFVTLRKNKVPT